MHMREDSEGRALVDCEIIVPDSDAFLAEVIEGVVGSSEVLVGSHEVAPGSRAQLVERGLAKGPAQGAARNGRRHGYGGTRAVSGRD